MSRPLVSACFRLFHPYVFYQTIQMVETSSEDRCEVFLASLYTGVKTPPAKALRPPEKEVWRKCLRRSFHKLSFILQHSTHLKKKFEGKS